MWRSDKLLHDVADGARTMHGLQNYGAEEPKYDGNAYSNSNSFPDGQLKLYGHQPTRHKLRRATRVSHNSKGFLYHDWESQVFQ
jgi:hypothetical protein